MRNEFLARYLVNSVFSQVWQEGCILILAGRFKPQQELPDNLAPALHLGTLSPLFARNNGNTHT